MNFGAPLSVKNDVALESILQANLPTPARIVVAVIAIGIACIKLIYAVAFVGYWAIVDAKAVAIGVAPVFVEQVAKVDDVQAQFYGVGLATHLEAILLSQMEIEVLLKCQVISKSLVILVTMLA